MSARIILVILCAAVAGGCGGREQSARRFVERGDADLAAGRDAAAVIEYRNAIKQRPAWAEAYRKLGDAYMAQGDSEEAYRAYTNAIELAPSDIHSHSRRAACCSRRAVMTKRWCAPSTRSNATTATPTRRCCGHACSGR